MRSCNCPIAGSLKGVTEIKEASVGTGPWPRQAWTRLDATARSGRQEPKLPRSGFVQQLGPPTPVA